MSLEYNDSPIAVLLQYLQLLLCTHLACSGHMFFGFSAADPSGSSTGRLALHHISFVYESVFYYKYYDALVYHS